MSFKYFKSKLNKLRNEIISNLNITEITPGILQFQREWPIEMVENKRVVKYYQNLISPQDTVAYDKMKSLIHLIENYKGATS